MPPSDSGAAAARVAESDTQATPALAVTDLVVSLGGREILHGVSLTVEPGEIVGFVGPNGAGKTTTMRTVLGLYPPQAGTVLVFGAPAGTPAARHALGFALDTDGLYDGMSAAENVAFYQRLYDVPRDDARVAEVLALVGLAARADEDVRTFSRGMRQRAAIARALVHRPGLLVLDEPTSGIDPTGQREICELLALIAESEGTAILMSSHDLDQVQRLASGLVVLAAGTVRLAGDLGRLRRELGSGSVTLTTDTPLSEQELEVLRADEPLGLRTAAGARLTFVPHDGVTRSHLVAAVVAAAPEGDITALTSDDASLDELFASAVAAQAAAAPAPPIPSRGRSHGARAGWRRQ